jgi:hypothetical protein
LARTRRLDDNAGMARDDGRAHLLRVELMFSLDGVRPSGASGTEAPTLAEVERIRRQQRDLVRRLGLQAPATAGTQTPTARQRSRLARSVQRRRPRIAAGSALVVAGSAARLRAAAAEPLR